MNKFKSKNIRMLLSIFRVSPKFLIKILIYLSSSSSLWALMKEMYDYDCKGIIFSICHLIVRADFYYFLKLHTSFFFNSHSNVQNQSSNKVTRKSLDKLIACKNPHIVNCCSFSMSSTVWYSFPAVVVFIVIF